MGILVGLFGVGYLLVAANPVENHNILLLGFWSKALSSLAALGYVSPWVAHPLPLWFAGVVFLADIIYLPPFYVILRRLSRLARGVNAPSHAMHITPTPRLRPVGNDPDKTLFSASIPTGRRRWAWQNCTCVLCLPPSALRPPPLPPPSLRFSAIPLFKTTAGLYNEGSCICPMTLGR